MTDIPTLLSDLARLSEASSKEINAIGTHLVTPQIAAGMQFVQINTQVRIADALERIAIALEAANAQAGGSTTDGALG